MKQINYIFIFCFIAIFFIFLPPIYGQGFMVRPIKMEFQPYPGQTVHRTLELSNETSQSITLDLKLLELTQNEQGHWQVIEPNSDVDTSNLSSCLKWIKLSANSVEVKPLEMAPVKVKLTVPRRTHGFYAAALLLRQDPQNPKWAE